MCIRDRSYTGQWANNQRHGTGRQEIKNVGSFDGSWSEDRKVGPGKFVWIGGEAYEGEWEDDAMHGFGTFESAETKFTGMFCRGKFQRRCKVNPVEREHTCQ
eukprot:TRINITY_DN10618_c0_g1_i2.p2 TRINITY_DN10618_c0_g1~~TRINITY_DN10618_c0_g1_i2.p2  ORF type:complete len:102 (-),score=28.80 TRINITY_DN10618_c0_g1_i2:123-428(-)